jgi:cell wall-associated NlpC family hydrolase
LTRFDPRLTPARADLAARHLAGKVEAARFVEGKVREVIEPQAPLRRAPSPDAPLDSEALLGERVTVYEVTDEGWAWGQLEGDGYVGWLSDGALGPPGPPPTHRVAALRTFIFPGPSIKLPPRAAPPLGSRLHIARSEPPFAVTDGGGYLPAQHLAPLAAVEDDAVAVAERFVGAPYLWGGRTNLGIDCSGLVQVALTACGLVCPRDSDMQEAALGQRIDPGADFSRLRRGDLLFWTGHVAMARDAESIVHANAFHMAVVVESLAAALGRIRAATGELPRVRRLG